MIGQPRVSHSGSDGRCQRGNITLTMIHAADDEPDQLVTELFAREHVGRIIIMTTSRSKRE